MKACVTGGGGFLGRHIVEQLLERGDEVTIFSRGHYPDLQKRGVRSVRGDLADPRAVEEACTGQALVFHVAAKAGFWGKWDAFYRSNVLGTRHVLEACRKTGVARLVYTSTPSVVFTGRAQEGEDETLPYSSFYLSYYPKTKAIAEKLVLEADGGVLRTTALRPHLIWGPGDTQLLPRIIDRSRKGRLFQVGTGENRVDVTYVEDAARAHLLAAEKLLADHSPAAGSAYFISQGEPVNLWQFVNRILSALDLPVAKRKMAYPVARAVGALLEGAYKVLPLRGEPVLTRFLANELAFSHYYDISKAKRELGYVPVYSLEAGLEKTIAFFKEKGFRGMQTPWI